MPTVETKTIGSAGGRDYATPNLWIAAYSGVDLVAANKQIVGNCYNDSEFVTSSSTLDISGVTTDATRNVILKAAAGQSFSDNANVRTNALAYNASNGVGIRTTSVYAQTVDIHVEYVNIIGLQIKGLKLIFSMGRNNIGNIIANNIFESGGSRSDATPITVGSGGSLGTTGVLVKNNLIIQGSSSSAPAAYLAYGATTLIGNTIVRTANVGTGYGIVNGYATGRVVKDTAVFGFNAFADTVDSSSDYNAGDNASVPGSHSLSSLTFASQFVSSTNDFRAVSTGSLDLNGTPDSTNIPTDISGTTRDASTPTIGCWEVVVTSSGVARLLDGGRLINGGMLLGTGGLIR